MGVHGMSLRAGFTTPNMLEAETNKAFANAAEQLVVLADHTKWNTVGLASIAPLSSADVVVSDRHLDPAARDVLAAAVGNVVLVWRVSTRSLRSPRSAELVSGSPHPILRAAARLAPATGPSRPRSGPSGADGPADPLLPFDEGVPSWQQ